MILVTVVVMLHCRLCSTGVGGAGVITFLTTLRLLATRVHVTCCCCWHVAHIRLCLTGWVGGRNRCWRRQNDGTSVSNISIINRHVQKLGQRPTLQNEEQRLKKDKAGSKKIWELWRQMLIRCKDVLHIDLIVVITRIIGKKNTVKYYKYFAHSWFQIHNANDDKPTPVSRRCSLIFLVVMTNALVSFRLYPLVI